MPAEPRFLNDKLETLVRRCIVFPADGSETRLVHMAIRTVTNEDTSSLGVINRCVDMSSIYGAQNRKTRVMSVGRDMHMFYNFSLDLPANLNIARFIGITPAQLKSRKRLFWQGDVVVMKVLPESKKIDFIVKPLDADISEANYLEKELRELYQEGRFESGLRFDEEGWKFYVSNYCRPTSLLFGPSTLYWGDNASKKEEEFLSDLNEQRSAIGRPPIPRHAYMKSYTDLPGAIYSAFRSALWRDVTTVTGPPLFPQILERRIFETCALENPETCVVLVLVAKRVNVWLDPLLIKTVCITQDFESRKEDKLTPFLTKLSNGKQVNYYAEHIKSMGFFGCFFDKAGEINRILAVCTGITNLVINAAVTSNLSSNLNLFENPQAWGSLRRLTISLSKHSGYREPTFHHACFRNLTHLHLLDDDEDWSYYTGWKNLTCLTHLAFACSGPPKQLRAILKKIPSVQYVALGFYRSGQQYEYAETTVNNSPHIRAAWGSKVVFLGTIPESDWERGARGGSDFWDLVEQEVERRLQDGSAGH